MRVLIHVKLGEPLWRAAGQRRLALEWADGKEVTVADVLARLAEQYEGFAAAYAGQGLVRPYPYRVFVDAVLVDAPRMAPMASAGPASGDPPPVGAALQDGQTVFVLLPAAGG